MTTDQKYKAIIKRLGLKESQVAEMFGYTNAMSLANSTAKNRIRAGVVALFEHIGEYQVKFFFIDPNSR